MAEAYGVVHGPGVTKPHPGVDVEYRGRLEGVSGSLGPSGVAIMEEERMSRLRHVDSTRDATRLLKHLTKNVLLWE